MCLCAEQAGYPRQRVTLSMRAVPIRRRRHAGMKALLEDDTILFEKSRDFTINVTVSNVTLEPVRQLPSLELLLQQQVQILSALVQQQAQNISALKLQVQGEIGEIGEIDGIEARIGKLQQDLMALKQMLQAQQAQNHTVLVKWVEDIKKQHTALQDYVEGITEQLKKESDSSNYPGLSRIDGFTLFLIVIAVAGVAMCWCCTIGCCCSYFFFYHWNLFRGQTPEMLSNSRGSGRTRCVWNTQRAARRDEWEGASGHAGQEHGQKEKDDSNTGATKVNGKLGYSTKPIEPPTTTSQPANCLRQQYDKQLEASAHLTAKTQNQGGEEPGAHETCEGRWALEQTAEDKVPIGALSYPPLCLKQEQSGVEYGADAV